MLSGSIQLNDSLMFSFSDKSVLFAVITARFYFTLSVSDTDGSLVGCYGKLNGKLKSQLTDP